MARRRMPGDDGYGEQDALGEGIGLGIDKDPSVGDGEGDPFKIPVKLPGAGGQDGDVLGPNPETESGPMGSRERARDLRPTGQTPNTFAGLPRGVTVDDGMSDGGMFDAPDGGIAMDMPGQSFAPSPRSGNMSFAMPESGMRPQGPQRRSASPSVLYEQGNSPMLQGRAGGLMEGGLGASGQSDQTGPLQPTDLFQRLLQMFGRA